ncbi:ABC transporter permease [Zavarzinella formosa]|uniref:ABC transporter permease n=1 Tax=Zavarzinella formosa TaxID=360055 RepID=UPI0003104879|nr:ABC transporter permease [Zavarzinella formosa]
MILIRWRILKTLLHKEGLRHATNRGGLALAALLVTASLLLAALNPAGNDQEKAIPLVGGVHHCIIWHDDQSDWVKHLQDTVPKGFENNILFYQLTEPIGPEEKIRYVPGTVGIEIRTGVASDRHQNVAVWIRHPDGDRAGMAIYEQWFWRETYRFFQQRADESLKADGSGAELAPLPIGEHDQLWAQRQAFQNLFNNYASQAPPDRSLAIPALEFREAAVTGGNFDIRAAIATALVMFSLCFTCVYLMPSLTCEERERGLLLAQALSPATAFEILAAKFLFYPVFGMVLATLLAGIHNPGVLTRPFFWLALFIFSVGTLGIGITIACLARTQRAASLGALCYMLVIAMIMLVCQQNNITVIPPLALEYHAPHLLHATLTNQIGPQHWLNLGASALLATGWVTLATVMFRRRGWQ